MKKFIGVFLPLLVLALLPATALAKDVYVKGYYRKDGTYVKPHKRTSPNLIKTDNYSFNGDYSDSINDKSFYNKYGYDPEPFDDEVVGRTLPPVPRLSAPVLPSNNLQYDTSPPEQQYPHPSELLPMGAAKSDDYYENMRYDGPTIEGDYSDLEAFSQPTPTYYKKPYLKKEIAVAVDTTREAPKESGHWELALYGLGAAYLAFKFII